VSFTVLVVDLGAGSDPKSLCFVSSSQVPVKDAFCANAIVPSSKIQATDEALFMVFTGVPHAGVY